MQKLFIKKGQKLPEDFSGKIIEIDEKTNKRKVYTINKEPSMTDQSQKDDCDINIVIQRILKTGDDSILRKNQMVYADVSDIKDLGESLMQVQRAQDAFMSLPASIRTKFQNDPVQFIDFLGDPKNDDEAIQLGLKIKNKSTEEQPPKQEQQTPPSP